ncbi:MAG TPA: hypothetical protein ENK18_18465 [Deltaproteobacteria bacterium]|nr:hypothetical protein [Deltaproteobacteria bacterium]
MKRNGRARRRVIASLCPEAEVIVDVGADHGHVARMVGGIATERQPHRAGRPDVPWVIADGLRPFSRVDVAIIAGMGARTIASILEAGPTPPIVVLHAPDDPVTLRRWLAASGWRIDAEALAPEAGRFAEVIRATRGHEPATGPTLDFGPRLLRSDDPWLQDHLAQLLGYHQRLAEATAGRASALHDVATLRASFLAAQLASRRGTTPL